MTPEKIHQRYLERIKPSGLCLVWTGIMKNGSPEMSFGAHDRLSPRRYAVELSGRKLGPSDIVVSSCGNNACVNEAHLFVATRAAKMSATVKVHPPTLKVSVEQRAEIQSLARAGFDRGALAKKFNVTATTIKTICAEVGIGVAKTRRTGQGLGVKRSPLRTLESAEDIGRPGFKKRSFRLRVSSLGARAEECREAAGLGPHEATKRVGLFWSRIEKIEQTGIASVSEIAKLAKGYGTTFDYLKRGAEFHGDFI